MRSGRTAWVLLLLIAKAITGQTLDNRVLNGKYYFRHVLLSTDASGVVTDARSLLGAMTFDANGRYSFVGQQTLGMTAAAAFSGGGTYSVNAAGMVTLANPLRSSLTVNARYGAAALIGSSTESPDNVFDLFVAIPAPVSAVSNASLSGVYWVATLEFPSASGASVRNAFFKLEPNGLGRFADINILGHAATLGNNPTTRTVSGAVYALSGEGSGSVTFPVSGTGSGLISGNRTVYISKDSGVLLGGSTGAGAHDVLIGIKALPGSASNASWKDRFWAAGLRFEPGGISSFVGSLNARNRLFWTRRLHDVRLGGSIDFTGTNDYSLKSDGTGASLLEQVALGSGGDTFLGAGIHQNDPAAYEIIFGMRMPDLAGAGVFLNPHGIANGASFAPPGNPVSPGEFISLFGSGLAPRTEVAKPPYPASLAGVSVLINDRPAPVYSVSDIQLNVLVPYATQGPTANIVVNNNGNRSNPVTVVVVKATPGVFALDQSGSGPGAILHADFSLVSATSPARRGETVLVFLTGMGAVSPGVTDGTAGSGNPLSRSEPPVSVLVGGRLADVSYSGLAPGFPGLYQLNVKIPAILPVTGNLPFAIQMADSFHDQVDIMVGP